MFYDEHGEPFYEEKDFMRHVCPNCQPLIKNLFKSFRSSIAGLQSGLKKQLRENRTNGERFNSSFWLLDGRGNGYREAYDAFRRSVHYWVFIVRKSMTTNRHDRKNP